MASALSQAKQLAEYNNKLDKENVKLQYSYNKSLAEQDRSWQEMMSNSAHQREIADLKKAGLNPVLSVTGGNGATTPSGSSASVSKPVVDMSLPGKVMDMAIAQLNSATSLQTTAMNNAMSRYMHDTLGANSLVGQLGSVPYAAMMGINGLMDLNNYIDDIGLTGILAPRKKSSYRKSKLFDAEFSKKVNSSSKIKKVTKALNKYNTNSKNRVTIDQMIDDLYSGKSTSSNPLTRSKLQRKDARKERRADRLTKRALRRYNRKYG